MLPPPTTMATSVPSSARASVSSRAMRSTTSPSIVSSDAVLAKASPDSFSTTRRHGVPAFPSGELKDTLRSPLPADDDLGEPHDLAAAQHLLDALLVVLGERLLEQDALLVPAVQHAVDDLRQRRLRLAGVAGLRLECRALGLDLPRRNVLPAQVLRAPEGDVYGDVVRHLLRRVAQLDQHAVDATVVLHVQVGVDDVPGPGLVADHLTELDVLLQGDLEVVDGVGSALC